MHYMRYASIALSVAIVSGCGGGGGGGGGGSSGSTSSVTGNVAAAASGPGDSSSYFPLTAGNTWQYDDVTLSTPPSNIPVTNYGYASVTAEASTTILGQSVTPLLQSSTIAGYASISSYFKSTGGGLTFYGTNDTTDLVTPQTVPYAELLYPVAVGTQSTVDAVNISAGTTSSGDPLTTSFTQTTVVNDFESLAVDAGVFNNVAKLTFTQAGTITDTRTSQSLPFNGTQTIWLAPNVGLIKQQTTATLSGTTVSSESLALRGYTSNGTKRGLGNAFALATQTELAGVGNAPGGFQPVTATNGTNYFTAIGTNSGSLWVKLNDASGATTGGFTATGAPYNAGPVTWFDGTNFVIAGYGGISPSPAGLYAQRISPSGQQIDPPSGYLAATYQICTSSTAVVGVAAAPSGALLVTYCNDIGGTRRFVGTLINANGQTSATGDFVIASPSSDSLLPTVAFNGTEFLVLWTTLPSTPPGALYGTRVSTSGTVLDTTPVLLGNIAQPAYVRPPGVTSDGTNFYAVWAEQRNAGDQQNQYSEVFGARISPSLVLLDGTAQSPGTLLSQNGSRARFSPAATFNGVEFLAAWEDGQAYQAWGIAGARVSTGGLVTSGAGFEISVSGAEANPAGTPPSQTYNNALALLLSISGSATSTMITWTPINNGISATVAHPF